MARGVADMPFAARERTGAVRIVGGFADGVAAGVPAWIWFASGAHFHAFPAPQPPIPDAPSAPARGNERRGFDLRGHSPAAANQR